MTDDGLTPREIGRALARLEDADRALAAQLTRLATELLPVNLWDVQHKGLIERIARAEQDIAADRTKMDKIAEEFEKDIEADRAKMDKITEELEKAFTAKIKELREQRAEDNSRSQLTWQKVIGLVGALAALATVIVTLLGQSKGIH